MPDAPTIQKPALRYLSAEFDPATWAALEPVYAELEARELPDKNAVEQWLLDRSELGSLIAAESSRRNVAAARHTEDEAAEAAHLEYQTVVLPEVQKVEDRLDKRYLGHEARTELASGHWQVYDRETELAVELFREENLELESEEERLATEYGRLTGAMTVQFRGEEHTLAALGRFYEDPDRAVREEVWRLSAERRVQDAKRLDELFDELFVLRKQIAANAGFSNYRDFKHKEYARFDYSPADCELLHANVEAHVLPLVRAMAAHRVEKLGLDSLRPWDLAVDLSGRAAFQPFKDSAGQIDLAEQLFRRIEPEFAAKLRWLAENDLLDLETRPGKRQGGFMDTFEDERVPFIFSNSGTTHGDLETLVHEGGHAMHAFECRNLEPLDYRHAPIEFAEVASMAMESVALEHLHEVYPAEEAVRCATSSFETIARGLTWIATIDAFQHAIYTKPQTDPDLRLQQWVAIRKRFDPVVDWTGLDALRKTGWHRQLHLYEVPFYYVEYAIAQIGALQVWLAYRRDPKAAIERYRRGLALGGSRPLPELFSAAGLRFDPRGETLAELMAEVEAAWRATIS